jgi:hypothetical protein
MSERKGNYKYANAHDKGKGAQGADAGTELIGAGVNLLLAQGGTSKSPPKSVTLHQGTSCALRRNRLTSCYACMMFNIDTEPSIEECLKSAIYIVL